MTDLTQGSIEVTINKESQVTIGEGYKDKNKLTIDITNSGTEANVRVTLKIECGERSKSALLREAGNHIEAICSSGGSEKKLLSTPKDGGLELQTDLFGTRVPLTISLTKFESDTLPGDAIVKLTVEVKRGNGFETVDEEKNLSIHKETKGDAKFHDFTAKPDYILAAGQTPVVLSFRATGFNSIVLYRNNQYVQKWPSNEHPANSDGSIEGTVEEKPSITTVYRLEGMSKVEEKETRYRTVQVISPGWNQIALPQGYPARLLVNQDFEGGGKLRLYGIFIDQDGHAALYSSATGVDDWKLESREVPKHMAMSPGVAYENKLWLIGGSSVDPNKPGAEVWCYEAVANTEERRWNKKESFPSKMQARMGHACVVVQEIWVLGGYNNQNCFDDVWRFHEGKWEEIKATTKKWEPRLMHAAVCFRPDPPAEGEAAPPPEVYVYGGASIPTPEKGLQDLWSTQDGGSWTELSTRDSRAIVPRPGPPLAAALVTTGEAAASGRGGIATAARLFLAGTFLQDEKSNRVDALIFEMKRRNKVWQQSPVIDGWEQFDDDFFYIQAIAFNGFLFVWSLLKDIPKPAPKLNILVPR